MSNKQNDHFYETAYEAQCDDMRMWAIEQQLEGLRGKTETLARVAVEDREKLSSLQETVEEQDEELLAERVGRLAQQKTIQLMSERLDRIVNAVGGTAITPSRKEKKDEIGTKIR